MSLAARLSPTRGRRDVVRRIALERLVVDHLVRSERVPLPDPGRVVDHRVLDAGSGRHQPGLVGDQLEHVEVDRHDRRFDARALGLPDECPDDIVGLVALLLVDRDPERLDHLADLRELGGEIVRHARPGGLVLCVLLVAERRPREVEGNRDVVGLQVRETAQDDAAEAEDAVDQLTLGRRERREGVVAAVHEPEAVEQHQAFHLASSVSRRGFRPVEAGVVTGLRGGRRRGVGTCPARGRSAGQALRAWISGGVVRRTAARTSRSRRRAGPASRSAAGSVGWRRQGFHRCRPGARRPGRHPCHLCRSHRRPRSRSRKGRRS